MTNERDREQGQSPIEQATRSALNQNLQELPEDITSALAAARKKALEAAMSMNESGQPRQTNSPTAKIYQFDRNKMIWSGAIAASVTALALTLALQNPGADIPIEADYLLTLAELESLDDTEWALVQDLEFALWLSEMGPSELDDGAFATEPRS